MQNKRQALRQHARVSNTPGNGKALSLQTCALRSYLDTYVGQNMVLKALEGSQERTYNKQPKTHLELSEST